MTVRMVGDMSTGQDGGSGMRPVLLLPNPDRTTSKLPIVFTWMTDRPVRLLRVAVHAMTERPLMLHYFLALHNLEYQSSIIELTREQGAVIELATPRNLQTGMRFQLRLDYPANIDMLEVFATAIAETRDWEPPQARAA